MGGLLLPRRPAGSIFARWRTVASLAQQNHHLQARWFSCSSSRFAENPAKLAQKERTKLPDTPCRTRFAPSPTGYLHLGSLRTALFNYLLARATGGQFVLRIEDTDQSRLVPDAERKLYQDLKWAGLSWDEGPDVNGPFGPYRQSERLPLYHEHADKLLSEGKAYRCFCTPEALEEHKRAANEAGSPTLYPGTCSHVSPEESNERAAKGEKFAIRFKSSKTPVRIQDLVYNYYQKKEFEDDYIIIKRDGFPTYHFANVVDDKHMEITHVIRGAEWLISTPKHVELYNAFGWKPPQFAHLGLLVDEKRQKLSKRHSGVSMNWYQERNILPETLLNFVALLGWRGRDPATVVKKPGQNVDVMSLQEMVDSFNLKFSKGDIIVSLSKLSFFQKEHLKDFPTKLISDPALLASYQSRLVNPFVEFIHKVEAARQNPNATTTAGLGIESLGEPLPEPKILEIPHVGELIKVLMKSAETESGTEAANQLASGEQKATPAQLYPGFFPLKYLFWSPSQKALEDYLLQSVDLDSVTLHDKPASLAQAMAYLEKELSEVEGDAWNEGALNKILAERKNDIGFIPKGQDKPTKNTWKFCRWAILAGEQGFSIPLSMVILGQKETVRRLNAAKFAAEGAVAVDPVRSI
ncbi:putative mitochondrial glutamyl-tRNA synthetase [Podospora australis]|uniref:Glutamate--tRNA ligase, mitochondrial n=1 Tax=Podospora australis TaxID=1536484 RepID=A0AAN7AKM5_9PEZI|nr:putative mitochondrial glutamyl-tRNA synthetase [Podospora australis]